jgi:capsular polysaccharide biosynthesis protein
MTPDQTLTPQASHQKMDEEDEIDLIGIVKTLWKGRVTIIITTLVGAALGVIIAISSPKEYSATTILVPQSSNSGTKSQLSSLASLAGFDLGMTQSSDLSPILYPKIVNSIPFKLELMNTKFNFSDFDYPITLLDYLTQEKKHSVLFTIKKYTLGLPGVILGSFRKKAPDTTALPKNIAIKPINLTKDQDRVKRVLDQLILLSVDKKEGFLTLSVRMPEALAAAQVAQKAQELLQRDITRFKVEKAKADLNFIQERFNIAKAQTEGYQVNVAVNTDRFKDLVSSLPQVNTSRIQKKYDISNSVYQELAKQLEQAKIQVSKDTPVFTIVEPVTVPNQRSKPNRMGILFIWIFLGGLSGMGIIYGKKYISELKQKWNDAD